MRTPGTRALAGIGALALAVIGVGMGIATSGTRGGIPAEPANPATPSTTNPCPDILAAGAGDHRAPLTAVPDELPADPDRIWLCGDPAQQATGPPEPLTTGANPVVEVFNRLERGRDDMVCTEEYVLSYYVAFDYPEQRYVLQGELHGCRTVFDGTTHRIGGDKLLEVMTQQWQAQRRQQGPPSDPGACSDDAIIPC
ncbi:hypothetical protein [Enemella sp. A6]|uniref:hypothetical protein n=1 Tax=Enemella sp. A6 TaxID=3440152 RepID=UPI003EBF2159